MKNEEHEGEKKGRRKFQNLRNENKETIHDTEKLNK